MHPDFGDFVAFLVAKERRPVRGLQLIAYRLQIGRRNYSLIFGIPKSFRFLKSSSLATPTRLITVSSLDSAAIRSMPSTSLLVLCIQISVTSLPSSLRRNDVQFGAFS